MKMKTSYRLVGLFMVIVGVGPVSTAENLRTLDGLLDLTANGGTNPATGGPWKVGDEYRFAFCSSTGMTATATNIAAYDSFVQNLANLSHLKIGAGDGFIWKAYGSTTAVDARDHLDLYPSGTNVSVWLINGTTVVADHYADLYGFDQMNNAINKSELNGAPFIGAQYSPVWSGTSGSSGTAAAGDELGASDSGSKVGLITKEDRWWIDRFGNYDQSVVLPLYAFSQVFEIKGPAGTVIILK